MRAEIEKEAPMKLEEKIARVIDAPPFAMGEAALARLDADVRQLWVQRKNHALAKAEAILALLLASAERDGALEEAAEHDNIADLLAELKGERSCQAGVLPRAAAVIEALIAKPAVADDVVETPEQEAAIERIWAGLEGEADKWAEEIGLTAWIKNIVQTGRLNRNVPDNVREQFIHRQEALIDAFVRQVFAEGFMRGGESRKQHDTAASLLRSTPVQTDTAIEAKKAQ